MCETFTWYGSFTQAMLTIPDQDDQAKFARALILMAETGEIPEDIGYPFSMTLAAIRPSVENSVANHRNGKAGGRGNRKNRAPKPEEAKAEASSEHDALEEVPKHTRAACQDYFEAHGAARNQGRKFYDNYTAQGWVRNGQEIVDWRPLADMWIEQDAEKKGTPKPKRERPETIPCAACGAEATYNGNGLYTCSECGQLTCPDIKE